MGFKILGIQFGSSSEPKKGDDVYAFGKVWETKVDEKKKTVEHTPKGNG